jgi:uncharacterized protein (DUF2235 family)
VKRIITCNDGTWNTLETDERTNVVKMYDSICRVGKDVEGNDVVQLKAYDEGVGTGYSWKDKVVGGATGAGIDKNIKDMYIFISLNYEPGDEIYLFGFSRGAYSARSIAGFIRNCGILKPQFFHIVDKAYELYRDRNAYTTPDSDLMKSFRRNYCYEDITPIKFIGVWDTVGSLGIPLPSYKLLNQKKYKFHDVTLSSYVEHAYHALALDERRVLFEPTLWRKSETVKNDPNHKQRMEQRWFCGVHSNVGGGYKDCGLSNIALDWFIKKAQFAGLCFNNPPLIKENEWDKGEIMNSYTPMYWLWRPKSREPFAKNDTNETIDESVWKRCVDDAKYRNADVIELWRKKNSESLSHYN